MRISGYVIVYQNANLTMTNVMWTIFFVLFEPKTQIESFKKLMNTHHPNMKFTSEKEDN